VRRRSWDGRRKKGREPRAPRLDSSPPSVVFIFLFIAVEDMEMMDGIGGVLYVEFDHPIQAKTSSFAVFF
jgi:hypothetical protein